MNKFCSAETAVAAIKSVQTVASVGVIGWITPDLVLKSVAARFQRDGSPRDRQASAIAAIKHHPHLGVRQMLLDLHQKTDERINHQL